MTNLTLVTEYQRGAPEADTLQSWADSISTLTGGAHSVTVFYSGELVSAFETMDAVTTGMADMAWMAPSYYPSYLPTLGALSAPLLTEPGPETSEALFNILPQEAFDPYGLSLLAAAYTDPMILLTSRSFSASPEDLISAKIYNGFGAPGAALLNEAEAVPLSLPATELYAALQTGVLDGALVSASLAARLSLEEVSGAQLVFPQAPLFAHTRSLVINETSLQALPADLRNVLETSTGAGLSRQLGEAVLTQYQAALAEFAAAGGLNEIGGADLTAWQALAARQTQDLLNALGPQAQALYTAMEDARTPALPGVAIGSDFGTGAPFVFLVETALGISSATELSGATVALLTGSDQELIVDAYFRANNMIYAPVPVLTPSEAITLFRAGAADVLVVPASWVTSGSLPTQYEVLHEQIGTAPGSTSGDDTLTGTPGDDVITLLAGDDVYYALNGNDSVAGNQGNDLLYGGNGFDTLYGGNGNDSVHGGNGRDLAIMGAGNDIFYDNDQGGENGQDTVYGNQGNDTIEGGAGFDKFYGGNDNDLIYGRAGFDTLDGGSGSDTIFGGNGNDLILGNGGFDTLDGGNGNDTINGGDGQDVVFMGNGNDIFYDNTQGGDLGRDAVYGGNGRDTIEGGNGNDTFFGGNGDDLIFGRLGDDLINGGAGNDTMDGGPGADTFMFTAGDGVDVINGYEAGGDILQFDDALWSGTLSAAQVVDQFASVVGGDVVFDFGAEEITLTGISSLTGLENDLVIV